MLEQPSFGRRLRQLRLQQGKSQSELTGPGMSAAYLSRLESGARPPTERAVAYLAEQLAVPVESFAQYSENDLADLVMTLSSRPQGERDGEIRDLLDDALSTAVDVDATTRWEALDLFARQHSALGEFQEERAVLEKLEVMSRELNRPALHVYILQRIARCCRNLGDMEGARRSAQEALELTRRHQLRVLTADLVRVKLLLISAEAELGNLAEAAALSTEVCESLPHGEGVLAAEAYWTASTVRARQGNFGQAFELIEKALAAVESREELTLWMRLRLAAASLSLQSLPPRLERAQCLLTEVEPALKLAGPPRNVQELLLLKAQLAYRQGYMERSSELVAAAEGDVHLLTYRDQIRFRLLREMLAAHAGDPGADHRLRELAAQVQAARMPDLSAEVWRAIAEGAPATRKSG
ncbi:helix-turn-helix domain-containing protein [Streptomyces sp. NPDC001034]|uniref:helix-turn-helix domain-containing protein n=1 Tax=Streptomyces sp. NPDC001034 TaxID=3154375 RepID=UPI003333AA65